MVYGSRLMEIEAGSKEYLHTIGYATIKWLTNGSQLHHLRFEIQGLEVKD